MNSFSYILSLIWWISFICNITCNIRRIVHPWFSVIVLELSEVPEFFLQVYSVLDPGKKENPHQKKKKKKETGEKMAFLPNFWTWEQNKGPQFGKVVGVLPPSNCVLDPPMSLHYVAIIKMCTTCFQISQIVRSSESFD